MFLLYPDLIVTLPFSALDVKVRKLPRRYPKNLVTIGDHLLKRQLDLKMPTEQLAEILGIHPHTISQWVVGTNFPQVPYLKKMIEFIGYYPFPEPTTLGERIIRYRRVHGLNQKEFGDLIGFNESTVCAWERSNGKFWPKRVQKVEEFLKD